jgi:uncharacterized membrane protein (UPF0127 family)
MTVLLIPAFIGSALIVFGLYLLFRKSRLSAVKSHGDYHQAQVKIKDAIFRTEVADNVLARNRGLSGRESMMEDEAMLFTFPTPWRHSFWMKDMKFPLDIAWVRDGKIVDISTDVPIPKPGASMVSLPRLKPRTMIDSALEVNVGLAARHQWRVGDAVRVVIQSENKIEV